MIVAALVPETALLVPGASGSTPVLPVERAVALEAVRDLVATGPDRVLLVAPARQGAGVVRREGPLTATLASAGLDDDALGWSPPTVGRRSPERATARGEGTAAAIVLDDPNADARPTVVDHVASAVGLHLLAQAGWTGLVTLLEATAGPDDDHDLVGTGRALAVADERVAVLLCGSLSARRGPDAPLAEDERAGAVDRALLAEMVAGPDVAVLGAEASLDRSTAAALAVSAWAPWQVLRGVAAQRGGRWRGEVRHVAAPLGATYAVVVWHDRMRATATTLLTSQATR